MSVIGISSGNGWFTQVSQANGVSQAGGIGSGDTARMQTMSSPPAPPPGVGLLAAVAKALSQNGADGS